MTTLSPAMPCDEPAAKAEARAADAGSERRARIEDEATRILARWILGLRFAVFALLALTLPFVHRLFEHDVQYEIAAPVIAIAALRDVALGAFGKKLPLAAGVAIDQLAIAAVLAASGGAANPLSALFFVHVALAASLLPRRTTFALVAMAAAAFATLFFLPSGTCCPSQPANGPFSAHLYGMWISFVLSAALAAFFLTQVRDALDERAREIERLRAQAEENSRFAALGTLAAGTAHELATPLGTIGVLAGEIEDGGDARACASVIQTEVRRCREIITKMRGRDAAAGARGVCPFAEAVAGAVSSFRVAHPDVDVELASNVAEDVIAPLAPAEVATIVHALLENAAQATRARDPNAAISVRASVEGRALALTIADRGVGLDEEMLARVGEPFFTTKPPGEGMGLGLYLVRRMVERVGGRFSLRGRDVGAEVRVEVEAIA